VQDKGVAYWSGLETSQFFARIDGHGSRAENARHLIKSTLPVAKLPRVPVHVRPARAANPLSGPKSRPGTSACLTLAEAGRFAQSQREKPDLAVGRARILAQFVQANRDVRTALARWPDRSLAAINSPYPLLGKLTIRER
jgi:hypothetical protein